MFGNANRLILSAEFATLPFVAVPQVDSLEAHGVSSANRVRTPANEQLILEASQLLELSVSVIDCVVSTMIATL